MTTYTLPEPLASQQVTPPYWSKHPGGVGLPNFTSSVSPSAPIIGSHTRRAGVNQSLALHGAALTSSSIAIWQEGHNFEHTALRSASDRAQFFLKKTLTTPDVTSDTILRESVALVWPKNGSGFGLPVVMNRPEVFWTYPAKKWYAQDRTFEIFGENLSIASRQPTVLIQYESGAPVKATITRRAPEYLFVELPTNYQPGTYTIYVHNGSGGKFGWSKPVTLEVEAYPYSFPYTVDVQAQAGATNWDKLVTAILYARTVDDGATLAGVRFELGPYTYTQPSTPANFQDTGSGQKPPYALIGVPGKTKFVNASSDWATVYANQKIMSFAGPMIIQDCIFEGIRLELLNVDNVIERCKLDAFHQCVYQYSSQVEGNSVLINRNVNFRMEDCEVITRNQGVLLSGGTQGLIRNCSFSGGLTSGDNTGNQGINTSGWRELLIDQCTFQSTNALGGAILSRAFAATGAVDHKITIRGCTMRNIGPFTTASGIDTNTPETILFHGNGEDALDSTINTAPTATTVVLNTAYSTWTTLLTTTSNFDVPDVLVTSKFLSLVVLSGRCAGQYRRVTNLVDAGGSTITVTLEEAWENDIRPEASDIVAVRCLMGHNIITENDMNSVDDASAYTTHFARYAVFCWASSVRNQITRNKMEHFYAGVIFWNADNYVSWLHLHNRFENNEFLNAENYSTPAGTTVMFADLMTDVALGSTTNRLYAYGNICRNNICNGAECVAIIGVNRADNEASLTQNAAKGLMNTIVENNTISNIASSGAQSFRIGLMSNWSMVRNNVSAHAQAFTYVDVDKAYQPRLIVADAVIV